MEFFPKPFHCHSQRIVVDIISVRIPDLRQEPFSCDGFPLIFHQKLQKPVFCLADGNFFFTAKYCRFVLIHCNRAAGKILAWRISCPAQQRANAGMQHFQLKGLCHIIVRPIFKAGNNITRVSPDSQKNNGQPVPS